MVHHDMKRIILPSAVTAAIIQRISLRIALLASQLSLKLLDLSQNFLKSEFKGGHYILERFLLYEVSMQLRKQILSFTRLILATNDFSGYLLIRRFFGLLRVDFETPIKYCQNSKTRFDHEVEVQKLPSLTLVFLACEILTNEICLTSSMVK